MSTDPRTANPPPASGGPVGTPNTTTAPVGSPVLGATVTIALRRATDIRWGDTIAIPDEVFVPVPARVDGRRTWTWRGKPARLLANAHRWRWVYDVDQLDDEPGMGDSLPVGFRLLRISDDHPDQGQEHRSLIVAVREVELIEVQVPAADEDRHQAPQQRATAAVAGGEPTRPVTAALDFEDFPARDAVLRVFDRSTEPGCDDASDMYVLDVFGVSVLVRLRTCTHPASRPQLYVHIDNEGREPTHAAVEVCNGGETHYRI